MKGYRLLHQAPRGKLLALSFVLFCVFGKAHVFGEGDSLRVLSLIDSSEKYIDLDLKRAEAFSLQSLDLAKQLESGKSLAYAQLAYGSTRFISGQYSESLQLYNQALVQCKELKDTSCISRILSNRGAVYARMEHFERAFADFLQAIELDSLTQDLDGLSMGYGNIAAAYHSKKEIEKSRFFFKKAIAIDSIMQDTKSLALHLGNLGGVYLAQNKLEQTETCLKKALEQYQAVGSQRGLVASYNHLGVLAERRKDFETARKFYHKSLKISEQKNFRTSAAISLKNIGITYYHQGNIDKAIKWTNKQLTISEDLADSVMIRTGYRNMAEYHRLVGDYEKAYMYFDGYDGINHSLRKKEQNQLIKNLELKHSLGHQEKELELLESLSQQQLLKIENKNYQLYGGGFLALLLIVGLGVFVKVIRQKGRLTRLELNQKLLRSQINPHFIFNVFNSIQSYLINKQYKKGEAFLRKFAVLIRHFFDMSEKAFVTLEEDLKLMKQYLEVEQLRLGNKLKFHIQVDPGIDARQYKVPAFMAHTYLENAVWHGVSVLNEDGCITVRVSEKNNAIHLDIEDDGIGIEKSIEYKKGQPSFHRSRGMQLNKERMEHLNVKSNAKYGVRITDLSKINREQTGTRVELQMPIKIDDYVERSNN